MAQYSQNTTMKIGVSVDSGLFSSNSTMYTVPTGSHLVVTYYKVGATSSSGASQAAISFGNAGSASVSSGGIGVGTLEFISSTSQLTKNTTSPTVVTTASKFIVPQGNVISCSFSGTSGFNARFYGELITNTP